MRFARMPPITLLTRLTQLIESPCALNFRQSSWPRGGGGVVCCIATILSAAAPTCLQPASTTTRIEHVASNSNVLRPPFSFTFLCSRPAQRVANGTSNRGSSLQIAGKILIRFILRLFMFFAANVREIKRRQIEKENPSK